jgi:DNA replication ATP-dependent helicase Dna2
VIVTSSAASSSTPSSLSSTSPPLTLHLADDFFSTPLHPSSIFHITPPLPSFHHTNLSSPPILLNFHSPHLLILEPDILISCTKVADSGGCMRRNVLSDRFRFLGGEGATGGSGGGGDAKFWGVLGHEVMQGCLVGVGAKSESGGLDSDSLSKIEDYFPSIENGDGREFGNWDEAYVSDQIEKVLNRNLEALWACDISMDATRIELKRRFASTMRDFGGKWTRHVSTYDREEQAKAKGKGKVKARDDRVDLIGLEEVEEEIWSSKWGLKGKIDASVLASYPNLTSHTTKNKDGKGNRIVPLEIKTGKSVGTEGVGVLEHRGQMLLYTLLMSDRYSEYIASLAA